MVSVEIMASLEAILFACGGPVESDRLRELLQIDREELEEAVQELQKKLADAESGIELIHVETAYQLCTKPFVAETVKKALEMRKAPPLSKASLEVLAIVAYNQPVTRSFIETVRGVDSTNIVASLCDKGLLMERGYLDAPGHPMLFGTTDAFLRCFGLESIKDLPTVNLLDFPEQTVLPLEEMDPTSGPVDVSENKDSSQETNGIGEETV